MEIVEKVRFKPESAIARDWRIPPEVEGEVLCRYSGPARFSAKTDRVDVRFGVGQVIWGCPADEFELVGESCPSAKG